MIFSTWFVKKSSRTCIVHTILLVLRLIKSEHEGNTCDFWSDWIWTKKHYLKNENKRYDKVVVCIVVDSLHIGWNDSNFIQI